MPTKRKTSPLLKPLSTKSKPPSALLNKKFSTPNSKHKPAPNKQASTPVLNKALNKAAKMTTSPT